MSRTTDRKDKISDKADAEMAELGVPLLSGDPKTVAEEVASPTRTSRRSWRRSSGPFAG
jgi:hypothetical protein